MFREDQTRIEKLNSKSDFCSLSKRLYSPIFNLKIVIQEIEKTFMQKRKEDLPFGIHQIVYLNPYFYLFIQIYSFFVLALT